MRKTKASGRPEKQAELRRSREMIRHGSFRVVIWMDTRGRMPAIDLLFR